VILTGSPNGDSNRILRVPGGTHPPFNSQEAGKLKQHNGFPDYLGLLALFDPVLSKMTPRNSASKREFESLWCWRCSNSLFC